MIRKHQFWWIIGNSDWIKIKIVYWIERIFVFVRLRQLLRDLGPQITFEEEKREETNKDNHQYLLEPSGAGVWSLNHIKTTCHVHRTFVLFLERILQHFLRNGSRWFFPTLPSLSSLHIYTNYSSGSGSGNTIVLVIWVIWVMTPIQFKSLIGRIFLFGFISFIILNILLYQINWLDFNPSSFRLPTHFIKNKIKKTIIIK